MKNKKRKKISILIPLFFGEDIFFRCLETLARETENLFDRDWEILVYNNGFSEVKLKDLKTIYPWVKFFGTGNNVGFAKANNYLLKKSRGEFILLLNQDVFISNDAILELLIFLENNDKYDCVAPQLKYENEVEQYSCRPFPRSFSFLLLDFLTGGKKYRFFYSPKKSGEVDQPMASCLLFRGEKLRDLQGFDDHPDFFLYFNDTDLSYRLKKAGGLSYFLASVSAIHMHGQSTALLPEPKRLSLWAKGLGRFWFKAGKNFYWAYAQAYFLTIFRALVEALRSLAGKK